MSIYRALQVAVVVAGNIFCSSYAQTHPDKTVPYPDIGVHMGQGWRVESRTVSDAFCIEFAPPEASTALAQKIFHVQSEVRTQEMLRRTASSGDDIGVKAFVNLSSKNKFAYEYQLDTDLKSFAVRAVVQNTPETIRPPTSGVLRLKAEYLTMLKGGAAGLAQFRAECGEAFVYRRSGGAELVAITTLRSATLEESSKADFNLTVGANLSGFDIGFNSATLTEVRRKELKSSLEVTYMLRGGNSSTGAVDTESLKTLATTLPTLAANAPRYWTMDIRRYESLPNFPKININVPDGPNEVAFDQYLRLLDLLRTIRHAESFPQLYVPRSYVAASLSQLSNTLTLRVTALKGQIEGCAADSSKCSALPAVDEPFDYSMRMHLPVRKGLTESDRRLRTLLGARTEDWAVINSIWNKRCNFDPGGYAPSPSLTVTVARCKHLEAIEPEISALIAAQKTDVQKAVMARIRAVRDDRCRFDPIGPLCLPVEALLQYETQIATWFDYSPADPNNPDLY